MSYLNDLVLIEAAVAMSAQQPDLSDLWTRHQRNTAKTTKSWACQFCTERKIHASAEELWDHALSSHRDKIPPEDEEKERFKRDYLEISASKK
jgi:hypothetical protein